MSIAHVHLQAAKCCTDVIFGYIDLQLQISCDKMTRYNKARSISHHLYQEGNNDVIMSDENLGIEIHNICSNYSFLINSLAPSYFSLRQL